MTNARNIFSEWRRSLRRQRDSIQNKKNQRCINAVNKVSKKKFKNMKDLESYLEQHTPSIGIAETDEEEPPLKEMEEWNNQLIDKMNQEPIPLSLSY